MDNNPIVFNDVLGLKGGKGGEGAGALGSGDQIAVNGNKYTLVEVVDEDEKKRIDKNHYESQTDGGKGIKMHDDKKGNNKYIDSGGKFYRLEPVTPSEQKEKQQNTEKETPKTETPSGGEGPKTGGEIVKNKPSTIDKPTGKEKGNIPSDKAKTKNGGNPVTNNPTPVFKPRSSSLDNLNITFDSNDNTFDSPTVGFHGDSE